MTTEQQLLAEGEALLRRMRGAPARSGPPVVRFNTRRATCLWPRPHEIAAYERATGRKYTGPRASTRLPVVRFAATSSRSQGPSSVLVDIARRTISGIASSRVADRVNDIVEPSGARFETEIPLLLHHDPRQPIGIARLHRTADGISFDAEIPVITDAGELKNRVDLAWQSARHGLLRGVSIGFLAVPGAAERLSNGGTRFKETEICELSLVSIPMNRSAVITAVGAKRLEQVSTRVTDSRHKQGDRRVVDTIRTTLRERVSA